MRATDFDPETLYNKHYQPLVQLALARQVPPDEAAQLAHDVLLASLLNLHRIADLKAWLTGALSTALNRKART
jgi:DNA-directed RNA polymerase specialized sigma24 family protein